MTDAVEPQYGRWLAGTRVSLGLTQRALADTIGVTVTTIARYEMGIREPREATRQLIDRALDAQRHELNTEAAAV